VPGSRCTRADGGRVEARFIRHYVLRRAPVESIARRKKASAAARSRVGDNQQPSTWPSGSTPRYR
jgi:hypothetical protein